MGVFTRLSDADVVALVALFDLGALTAFEPIAAGTINSNYDVRTERGRYFVRINEGKAEVDVAWEARLVAALADGGFPTVPAIPARDGRPYAALPNARHKWVSVFPWCDGHHVDAAAVTPAIAGALGAALARFHVLGLAQPTAWRRGSIYDHDHLVARFQRIAAAVDPALVHACELLGDELAIAADAASLRRRAIHGIIHGDLFRDNVLWRSDADPAHPRIAAILDFEQASGGTLVYDLAVCLNDWCWDGGPRLDLATALIAGYTAVRPLDAAERVALPLEIRLAATRFTITRITDVYLARVANPEKDFRAFLARVEAWRGPLLGGLVASL